MKRQSVSELEDSYIQQALREAFDWYKQADSKAQTILGFNGAFLSIVFASIVLKAAATSGTASSPHIPILILAAVLALYLAATGLCVAALWSRGILRTKGKAEIFFFGYVANFKDGVELLREVNHVYADPALEHGEQFFGRAFRPPCRRPIFTRICIVS